MNKNNEKFFYPKVGGLTPEQLEQLDNSVQLVGGEIEKTVASESSSNPEDFDFPNIREAVSWTNSHSHRADRIRLRYTTLIVLKLDEGIHYVNEEDSDVGGLLLGLTSTVYIQTLSGDKDVHIRARDNIKDYNTTILCLGFTRFKNIIIDQGGGTSKQIGLQSAGGGGFLALYCNIEGNFYRGISVEYGSPSLFGYGEIKDNTKGYVFYTPGSNLQVKRMQIENCTYSVFGGISTNIRLEDTNITDSKLIKSLDKHYQIDMSDNCTLDNVTMPSQDKLNKVGFDGSYIITEELKIAHLDVKQIFTKAQSTSISTVSGETVEFLENNISITLPEDGVLTAGNIDGIVNQQGTIWVENVEDLEDYSGFVFDKGEKPTTSGYGNDYSGLAQFRYEIIKDMVILEFVGGNYE